MTSLWDQGLADGRAAGRAEGRLEGVREALVRLLGFCCGELPSGEEARVRAATEPDLFRWADRIVDALDLEDVLGPT